MKRSIMLLFVCVLLVLSACEKTVLPTTEENRTPFEDQSTSTKPVEEVRHQPYTPDNLKAVWLSQWDMQRVYVDQSKQRPENDFRVRASEIMQNAVKDGFNTVFLQVRPFGDSFYPSEVYPPSKMVVGEYGREFEYDPVEILVEAAHKENLSIHAWINPFRLVTTEEMKQIGPQYAVKKWYDSDALRGQYLILQGDGRWYLNPGYSEVRELIVSGAKEIMERYEVDGLHLDDYFYPTASASFDAECFSEYVAAGGEMNLSDFRRTAVSDLVKTLRNTVHSVSEGALFGIAPGGNPDRAYSSEYADVFRWCEEDGFLDYICPEIYFGFEHETYPFDETAQRWSKMVTASNVRLIIGVSFHKASAGFDQYAGSGAYEWAKHHDILYRSLECAAKIENCSGVSVFSYQYFRTALTGEVPDYPKEERQAFLKLWKQVIFPASVQTADEM